MKWYGDHKGRGLFAKRKIKAGKFLIIEYPLLKLNTNTDPENSKAIVNEIHSIVNNKMTNRSGVCRYLERTFNECRYYDAIC